MSDHRAVPPEADPSPETVRHYLTATAQRELDALRAELDVRLSALETALARPDPRTSLEDVVLELARVATAEAESAAARACLEAELHAQERAAAAFSKVKRSLEAERALTQALRLELEQARTALETEREAAVRLQLEIDDVRTSLGDARQAGVAPRRQIEQLEHAQERAAAAFSEVERSLEAERALTQALRLELEQARTALETEREAAVRLQLEIDDVRTSRDEARQAGVTPRRQIEQLEHALQNECARSAALDSELVLQRDAVAQLSDALATLQSELAAAQQAVDTRAADDDARRVATETLERRCVELDRQYRAAVASTSEAASERDALAAALASERQRAAAAQAALEARAAAIDSERAQAERRWKDAEARAAATNATRDELAARLDAAEKLSYGMSRAVEARLAAIDANRTRAVKAWEEAKARAEAALGERDALATELDALRQATRPDVEIAQRLEAAAERIRVLELQLFERDRGPRDRDVDLGSLLDAPARSPSAQAGQRATRYGFPAATRVQIDGEGGLLVDLSVTGAQVICATSPEVGRIVTLTLLSDETPCFCQGRLLWARREQSAKGRPFRYRVGLVFTAVDEATIEAFAKRHSIS